MYRWLSIVLALLISISPAAAAPKPPLKGFWLSPDWILEGISRSGPPGAADARRETALVLDRLKAIGANAVFMEAYLRGYLIAPLTDARGAALPVYPLTRLRDGDMMAVVLEEAQKRGIAVHAWVHMLFWRTDNPSLTRPHHESRSVWDDLTAAWLREGAARLNGRDAQLALAAAQHLTDGSDEGLAGMLKDAGWSTNDGVLQAFQSRLAAAGAAPPGFLVGTPDGMLHPEVAKDHWATLYLNPEDPRVCDRLVSMVGRISEQYPGLAGIHLDHIRYPRGMLNVPRALAGLRVGMTFPGGAGGALFKQWRQQLRQREEAVTRLVRRVRGAIRPEHVLSSAVHPMYYFERDEWPTRLSADDFVSQDWHAWGLDIAMPMVYDSDAARVGRVLKRLRFGLMEQEGRRTVIVPGVNQFRLLGKGPGTLPAWAYFDFEGLRAIRSGRMPTLAREDPDEPSDTMD